MSGSGGQPAQGGDGANQGFSNMMPPFPDQQQNQTQSGMPFAHPTPMQFASPSSSYSGHMNAPSGLPPHMNMMAQSQQMPMNAQPQPFNFSDASGLSAIHTPIDFGSMDGGMTGFQPMLNQQQPYGMPDNFLPSAPMQGVPMMVDNAPQAPGASMGAADAATGAKAPKEKKAAAKPRAKAKPKVKEEQAAAATPGTSAGPSQQPGDSAKAAKPSKPRKKKSDADTNAGTPGLAVDPTGDTTSLYSERGKGPAKGRGGSSGSGRGGAGGARKPTKKQQQQQQLNEAGTPSSMHPMDDTSRSNSVAPGTPLTVTGESTPTKRGGRGGAGGRGSRGGRGRRGSAMAAGRGGSRGSRAASGRMTASVAPGGDDMGTAAPEDVLAGLGAEANEDGDYDEAEQAAGGGGESGSEDDANADEGLEEDELDRQEAIQRQRSINMGPLMKAMTEDQLERYSAFRRHYLDKRFVRRLVYHLTRQTVTPQVTTLCAGVGKVFIGEIIELARAVREESSDVSASSNDAPPLRPEHLIEALRRYREEREVPGRYPPGGASAPAGIGGNGKRRKMF